MKVLTAPHILKKEKEIREKNRNNRGKMLVDPSASGRWNAGTCNICGKDKQNPDFSRCFDCLER